MPKKRKSAKKLTAAGNDKIETKSESSIGTEQLQKAASRSTKNIFSQMLSRSK